MPQEHNPRFFEDPDTGKWMFKCSCGKKEENLSSRGKAVERFGAHVRSRGGN